MSTSQFLDIILMLLGAIIVVGVLGTLTQSRFTKTKKKDEFRNKNQIGKQNLGKLKQKQTYKEIAKSRNLEEAKNFEPRLNPKVTKSLSVTTKDMRSKNEVD